MVINGVTLAIIDKHTLFRKLLKNHLSEQNNVNVIHQISSVYELENNFDKTPLDIIVIDIFTLDLDWVSAIRFFNDTYGTTKILVLSMVTDTNLISNLLDFGIHGYISKLDEPETLLNAIYELSENRIYRNSWYTEALYMNKGNNINSSTDKIDPLLTSREKEIIRLIWKEKSSKEISEELFLGVRAIEKIRQNLMEKIGVKSTVGILKYALKMNIISS